MNAKREPDPEGDSADENPFTISEDAPICPSCGGPLDEDSDCSDATCPKSPYHLDESDDDEPDFPEGLLGEGDKDA